MSGDGSAWHLVDAGPDLAMQISATPELHPGPGVRSTPLDSVLLTDAQVDHVIGLPLLREAGHLTVTATSAVLDALENGPLPLVPLLQRFTMLDCRPLEPGVTVHLDGGLAVTALPLSDHTPPYAEAAGDASAVVGLLLSDSSGGDTFLYAPSVQAWTPELDEAVRGAAVALIDGTCWEDDDLARVGAGERTAAQMGHLPMGGTQGTVARCEGVPARVYHTHINNTNPVLDPASPERALLVAAGGSLAEDGMRFVL